MEGRPNKTALGDEGPELAPATAEVSALERAAGATAELETVSARPPRQAARTQVPTTTEVEDPGTSRVYLYEARKSGSYQFWWLTLVFATLGFLGTTIMPPTMLRNATMVAMGLDAVVSTYWLVLIHRGRTPPVVAEWIIEFVVVAGTLTAGLYTGPYAVILAFVTLALYQFGQEHRVNIARAVVATYLAFYFVLLVLILTDLFDDRGLLNIASLPYPGRVLVGSVTFVALAGCVAMSLMLRGAMADSLVRAQTAIQESTRRELLLQEARFELARALRLGNEGRYSGMVLGTYRLGSVIGRGGMGEVYEGSKIDDDGVAAIKTLRLDALVNPTAVERFFHELRVIQKVDSPHIVRVLEVSSETATLPYLAMERLSGQTLAELLSNHEQMVLDEARILATEIGAGLAAAHAEGIVHRDLKPQNLFLHAERARSLWKVLDFGVAKVVDVDQQLTREGHAIGTPSYMSPEQARGQPVDTRSDTYGFAAVLYRAVTGAPPFSEADLPATLYAISHERAPKPSRFRRLPAAIDAVLAVAMAKDKARRFASVTDFATAFAAATNGGLSPALERRAAEVDTFES